LVDFFSDIAALDGPFLIYDNGYRVRTFSYRQTARMAWAFASRLRTEGIRKGDRVLIWSENRPGWIAALWGCVLEGVILVPLDYRTSADFLNHVAKITEARALLSGDDVSVPGEFPGRVWRLSEIEEQSVENFDPINAAAPTDTVEIVFTSGATAE